MADVKIPRSISTDEFLNQIRCGMHDAVLELMTAGTANPGDAFYGAIRDGTREAMRAVAMSGKLQVVPPEPNAPAAESGPESPPGTETGEASQ